MNVALISTYKHGGAGAATRKLYEALQEIGVPVDWKVATPTLPRRWPFYAERLSFLPYERDKSVRFSFSLANFGEDISRDPIVQKADILHFNWISQGFLSLKGIQNLARLNKPIVWTMHDMWAFTGGCHYSGSCENYRVACGNCPFLKRPGPSDLSHRIWQRKKLLFPKGMHFVSSSEWLAEMARNSSLLRDYPVDVIPNPIDTAVFKPMDAAGVTAFRQQYGIRENTFVLLFVAVKVQEERKGFRYFKESLSLLKQQQPDLPLSILVLGQGDPDSLGSLPYPIHSLGMVRDLDLLSRAYAASDVFVIPSLEDNLPGTVLESLACGTPVVGFQTGGIPDMVDHQKNGVIVQQRDSEGLAKGVQWVLDGDIPYEKLRVAAREKAVRVYANKVVANRFLRLYEQVLGK